MLGSAGNVGNIPDSQFRPELFNIQFLAKVNITTTFIVLFILTGQGFRPNVTLILYSF
jgi:hypothetical protein